MKATITFLVLLLYASVHAATYYVSNTGSDLAAGTSEGTAWQTIAKVNATTFSAGDIIKFQKGGTWTEALTITESGSIGSPITITSYGTGANPIINGFVTVGAWTNITGNIWESTSAVSALSSCNMVAVGGVNKPMGRYPNTTFLTITSHSGKTSVTSTSLSASPDFTGADIVMRTNQWVINRRVIATHSSSTLTFTATDYEVGNGYGFFIQNSAQVLDVAGEWYYNPSTKKLRIYNVGTPTNVKLATIDYLATITGSYITIDGIDFTGANNAAIYNNSDTSHHLVVRNCNISFSGKDGIRLRKYYLTIEDNTINESGVNGIVSDNNKYSTIQRNTVSNSGYYASIGDGAFFNGISASNHSAVLVANNTITNSGYCGITFWGDSIRIVNNYIHTFCTILQDGAGIYTNSATVPDQNRISGNIVVNGVGAPTGTPYTDKQAAGIYLDQQTANTSVYQNTVVSCRGNGLFLNNTVSCLFRFNNVYDCDNGLGASRYTSSPAMLGNVVKQNKIFAKSGQWIARFQSPLSTTPEIIDPTVFALDSNYYARPITDFDSRPLPSYEGIELSQSGIGNEYLTVAAFKTRTSQEANGSKSPFEVNNDDDFTLAYNTATTAQTVSLPYTCKDMTGYYVGASVSIPAYSSKVLFKDIQPDPPSPSVYNKAWVTPSGRAIINSSTGRPLIWK